MDRKFTCPKCGGDITGRTEIYGSDPLQRFCFDCLELDDVSAFDKGVKLEIPDEFLLKVMNADISKTTWPFLLYVLRLGREWKETAVAGFVGELQIDVWADTFRDKLIKQFDYSPEQFAYAVEDVQEIWDLILEYELVARKGFYPEKV